MTSEELYRIIDDAARYVLPLTDAQRLEHCNAGVLDRRALDRKYLERMSEQLNCPIG